MKEQSQLEAMRAAVRGDLERAQARRDADPWREPEPEPIQSLSPEVPETPALEAEREPELLFAPEPEPEPEPVAEVEPEPPTPPVSDTKRGFLSRLFR
jgi:hypothetical protein